MTLKLEPVYITPSYTMIPIPWGMGIGEAWERIKLANEEGRPAWPEDTILKGYATIMTSPAGRILAVQVC